MLYMLAADMVMSPAGFRGKHYSDSLDLYPGWIPLLPDKGKIPDNAMRHAIFERKHLLPCIASFDLRDLSGPVRILSQNGLTRNVASLAARKRKDDIAILIPTPIPTTLLARINFRSSDDRQAFERAAYDVSNVDLMSRQLVVSESLFETDTDVELPSAQPQATLLDAGDEGFPAFGQALGGALAMLYHIANRSDLGLDAFRLVTGKTRHEDIHLAQSDPILAELPSWMNRGEIPDQADVRAQLFWGVVRSLVSAQAQGGLQTPIDAAMGYLESQRDRLREMEFGPRLERLIADMRDCLGLGGGTITELLERHKGSLSRPLLMFCLRENCTELLDFSHPLLKDAEYILAGILFGVRDGWLRVPKELRHPDVSAYVAHRMADAEQLIHGGSLILGTPPRPKPLREFFTSSSGVLHPQQRAVALELARECSWNDCIQTRITLAGGDYPASFERSDLQVVLPGRVTAVTEEVDMEPFLHRLGRWPPINLQIEAKMRKTLVNGKESEKRTDEPSKLCG